MKNPLPEFEQSSLNRIAEKYDLAMILFFGSRVTGKHRPHSDLDVGVWLDKEKYGRNCVVKRQFLRELFADLADTLDTGNLHLVILNHASPLLLFEAARTGKPVYQKEPGFFTAFSVYAAKKHWDNAPLYKMEDLHLKKVFGPKVTDVKREKH